MTQAGRAHTLRKGGVLLGAACSLFLGAPAAGAQPAQRPGTGATEHATSAPSSTPGQAGPTTSDSQAASQTGSVEEDLDSLAEMDLEQLLDVEVVTATKTKKRASEAPAIVSVVTRRDIERRGYQSVAEVLQHTVGFYLVDDHVLPNAGVRGIAGELFGESGTIKVMIDGRSVAFRPTGGNWLGPELVPLSAVERIEIIRGPSSALYGADAFLGVVNIITRNGEAVNGADVRASLDSAPGRDPGLDLDLSAGARKGPLELLVAARLHREDRSGMRLPSSSPAPQVPEYRLDDPTSRGADGSARVVLAKATYHYDASNSLTLAAYQSEFERGSEFSPWMQLPYGVDDQGRFHETRIALRQSSVGLVQDSQFGENSGLTLRGFYFSGAPTSEDRIDVGSDLFEVTRDFGYAGWEGQIEARAEVFEGLGTVVGAEAVVDRETLPSRLRRIRFATEEYRPGEVLEGLSTRQGSTLISNVGAFAQASWTQLEPNLSLVGGLRIDYHSIYGEQLSGRVGAVSNPIKPWFIKLLYGSAFRAPSPLLLYGLPFRLGDVLGNPDLEAQRVHTVEGQFSLRPLTGLVVSTGVSYSLLNNKAAFVQRGVNRVARNIAQVRSLSWETEVLAELGDDVSAYGSFELPYTIRDTGQEGYQAQLVGDRNVIYPAYILRGGASGKVPYLPLRPGFEVMVVGPRRASEMNMLEHMGEYELPAYTMLDVTLSTVGIELLDGRETVLMLKGRNLLDVRGPDPGFAGVDYPLLSRSVMAQLRQQF